jgi:SAM-dependent methyltransferase
MQSAGIGRAAIALAVALLPGASSGTPQRPAHPPDIHFASTPQPVVNAMLALAGVTADDVVYDLGSGDGRVVVVAAQRFGARGVGIEIDPQLVERSREIARAGGVADRATFVEGDLFTADISGATVVTLFLSDFINARLESKLKHDLRPGTRIVSHQFPIGRWKPDATVRVEGADLFLWTLPAR